MMLYVFQVDVGCMYTFELNLTLESVSTLKNAIATKLNISFDNQVLLISGGDYLEDNHIVHHYNGAGTVSNPIFLFDKSVIMSPEQFSINQSNNQADQYIEYGLKQIQVELEDTLKMDASLKAVIARTDIAKKINQLTTDLMSNCEQLIKDQHLQYQGWMACIANLEDVSNSFVENVKSFEESLKFFLSKRDYYREKLSNFNADLDKLEKIKILPCLHGDLLNDIKNDDKNEIKNDEQTDEIEEDKTKVKENGQSKSKVAKMNSELDQEQKIDSLNNLSIDKDENSLNAQNTTLPYHNTLMGLISQKDSKHCLEKISVYCNTMLEQFNEPLLDRVQEEMNSLIKTINDNKKIKKIENRLYNLDMLLMDVRQHVQDQNMLTFGFIQNQNSANTYKDDKTIFTDLCNSHKAQLDLMLKYYLKTMAIRKKFQNSKRELTNSLLFRLSTIMICETDLNSLNWRVLLYSESLKKLKRSLEVIDQINLAPKVYFTVFEEMVRRNKFNFFFNLWSNFIVQINSKLVATENKQRNEFRKMLSSHFLKTFFPQNFDDNVPEFGINMPENFDQTIPQIDEKELIQFIEQNKQFDNNLESEDTFLNGLVCKMNSLNKTKDHNVEMKDESSIIEKISETEKASLTKFVDSLFPIKQKHSESIEKIKNRLNDEYEHKLNELKFEYKKKLDDELEKLNDKDNRDDLKTLNCQLDCNKCLNSKSDSNIETVNLTNDLSNNLSNNISNSISICHSTNDSQSTKKEPKELPVFLNYKNLIDELLAMKFTDLKENNGPNFISFVSTLLKLNLPKNYF